MTPNLDPPPPLTQQLDTRRATAPEARPARRRTYLKGKLVYGDGAFTLDCAIQDISDKGAKILLDKRQALPADLYLIVVKQGIAYKAHVVWQKFPARGLKFSDKYLLDASLPEGMQFLRRLWTDLCARPGLS